MLGERAVVLDVYITIDTEIWCGSWDSIDSHFAGAFQAYIYGPTSHGDYALPATLSILQDYGLKATFFVEPVFSGRFGIEPLTEIVGLIKEKDQDIQLHLHPEWLDEARPSILEGITKKVPVLTLLTEDQQYQLICWGLERLRAAGASELTAFRSGSYAANRATLRALKRAKISFDSSYNLGSDCGVSDIASDNLLSQPSIEEGVCVYPVSVIRHSNGDGFRNVQLTALSYRELVRYLEYAYDQDWDSVVLVSHNFELLGVFQGSCHHFLIF